MNILGISGQERDAAAALVRDGRVVAAIEEEKLARIRHIGMNYAGGLPFRAIEFCLERAGILSIRSTTSPITSSRTSSFTARSLSTRRARSMRLSRARSKVPALFRRKPQRAETEALRTNVWLNRGSHQARKVPRGASSSRARSQRFLRIGLRTRCRDLGRQPGDMTSAALMTGEAEQLRVHAEAQFPNSIGMVYGAVTAALGFDPRRLAQDHVACANGKPSYSEHV